MRATSPDPSAAAVVVAAGAGSRFGRAGNKVYATVRGRSLLSFAVEALQRAPSIGRIVLVIRPEERPLAMAAVAMAEGTKVDAIVAGGASRHASEVNGIEALASDVASGVVDVIAVHDGARPFPGVALVERVVAAARTVGGAIPGTGFEEPVLALERGRWSVLDPAAIVAVQTPQAFAAAAVLAAYRAAPPGYAGVDTAETVARWAPVPIAIVPGEAENLKVTYRAQLARAARIAAGWRP